MNEIDARLDRIEAAINYIAEWARPEQAAAVRRLLSVDEEPAYDYDGPYDDPTRAPRMSGGVHSLQAFQCDSRNPLTHSKCNRIRGHDGPHETTNGQSPMVKGSERWTDG